jgi:NADH-quinone oxidoreductase subunit E
VLSDEERTEIRALVPPDGQARGAVVEALSSIQTRRGWVSDEDVEGIADVLGMTPAEVQDVATFYSLIYQRPVGRHVLLVCDSVSCWLNGYEDVLAHLTSRLGVSLGETTPDGAFTLLPAACLGLCDRAPALMVDDVPYGPLDAEAVDALLRANGWSGRPEAADMDRADGGG